MYFDAKIETAGNMLNLINVVINDKPNGQKTAVGLRFAQYAQLQYDFRYFHKTGPSSLIAFRTMGAVGFAYGNSDNMPYIKQYYIGGTNSLRPLSARSVGPGRFQQFESGEVNQVGDLKFETNIEYRFKMFYKFSGALWSDAGNIWLLEEDPNREGSGVRWNKLFKDSYLTAGAGIRLDLNFLVLRFDYGALLYVPYFEESKQWIWKHEKPFLGAAIGLGFPF
jgi:outer membrane protein assembly factor BamA